MTMGGNGRRQIPPKMLKPPREYLIIPLEVFNMPTNFCKLVALEQNMPFTF
jgi:hypothetical protein